jgi:hypothetical protein
MAQTETERRIASNQATFREANERIGARAEELHIDEQIPFLCECGEPTCVEIVQLSRRDYESVRAAPTWFFVKRGHETLAPPAARAVESRDGFCIVEKLGEAGEVAAERDLRS